jgi:hypothetical protein
MYDTSFDQRGAVMPRSDRRVLWALRIIALVAVIIAATADAQIPGAPVLQNVWATPGSVGAANVAGGGGWTVYAAALSWTPGFGNVQISGGGGFATGIGNSSRGTYGVRVAAPFGGVSSELGFGVFAGVGGGPARTTSTTVSCTVVLPSCAVIRPVVSTSGLMTFDSTTNTTVIPIGAAIGWRRATGPSNGVSVYASPAFVYYGGGTNSTGLMRVGIGIDAGLTSAIGVTGGFEFGGTRPQAIGGPSGVVYGLGVSYAFSHR